MDSLLRQGLRRVLRTASVAELYSTWSEVVVRTLTGLASPVWRLLAWYSPVRGASALSAVVAAGWEPLRWTGGAMTARKGRGCRGPAAVRRWCALRALHPYRLLVDQPGRAVLRLPGRPDDPLRRTQERPSPRSRHSPRGQGVTPVARSRVWCCGRSRPRVRCRVRSSCPEAPGSPGRRVRGQRCRRTGSGRGRPAGRDIRSGR